MTKPPTSDHMVFQVMEVSVHRVTKNNQKHVIYTRDIRKPETGLTSWYKILNFYYSRLSIIIGIGYSKDVWVLFVEGNHYIYSSISLACVTPFQKEKKIEPKVFDSQYLDLFENARIQVRPAIFTS